MQKQNAIKGQQSQDKNSADAKAGHPVVSKQKSDSSDAEKKSVQFAEEEKEEKKEREERHVNKTRTMRPKEKWEWAFSKILKNLEVRQC